MGEEHPYWCYEPHEIVYEKLDPGIREVVRFLVKMGFHTTDSGDGVSKGDAAQVPIPHVFMEVEPKEIQTAALDLVGCLRGIGITIESQTLAWSEVVEEHGIELGDVEVRPAPYVEVTYDPVEDYAVMGLYYVTSDMIKTVG